MAKTTKIPMGYTTSVTSVTKRDKRDILKIGLRAVKRDNPPYRGGVASRHPGTAKNPARELSRLKVEVLVYLNGYTSRGYHAEGRALARLRKAVDRSDYPAPSPGSPGSPEREAEQRIRNERATRMVKKLEELFDNQP